MTIEPSERGNAARAGVDSSSPVSSRTGTITSPRRLKAGGGSTVHPYRSLWHDPFGRSAAQLLLVTLSVGGFAIVSVGSRRPGGPAMFLSAAAGLSVFLLILGCTARASKVVFGPQLSRSSLLLAMLYVLLGVVAPALFALTLSLDVGDPRLLPDLQQPAAALWLVASGFSVTLVVHTMAARRRRNFLDLNSRDPVPKRLITIFFVGSLVSIANILVRGRFYDGRSELPGVLAPFEQLIAYAPNLMLLAIAGLAATGKRSFSLAAKAMVLVSALVGFAEGFFKPTLWAVIAYTVGSALQSTRQRRRSRAPRSSLRRWAPLLLVGTLFIVAVVPLVEVARVPSHGKRSSTGLLSAYKQTWGSGFNNAWEIFSDKAAQRQTSVFVGAIRAVERVPDSVPYKGLDELFLVPVYGIPSVLWPSKPDLTSGTTVSVEFFDAPADTRSSSSLLLFGDAFWYGALPAVLLVGIGVGFVMGVIDSTFRNHMAAICRIAALPLFIDFDRGVALWSVSAIQGVLFLGLIGIIASKPAR
jgi:hypothetical protein